MRVIFHFADIALGSKIQLHANSVILVIDHEGFTPLDIRQNPLLIDLERARCQNKCEFISLEISRLVSH